MQADMKNESKKQETKGRNTNTSIYTGGLPNKVHRTK
jgi:hypothetical protein